MFCLLFGDCHPLDNVAFNINVRKIIEKKRIIKLIDENIVTYYTETEKSIHNFYKKLKTLQNKNNFVKYIKAKIETNDHHFLESKITMEEIKDAGNSLKEGKSPGCDRIRIEFYKTYFDTMKFALLEHFSEIQETNTFTASQKLGIITLIHKGGDKNNLRNWKPLALLKATLSRG